jgi:putative ABC transport system ATP-binding protein
MLELIQLKRVYERTDATSLTAVDNVDLNIIRGDFICIVGKSGSGKSTLLNMAAGLLRPTSGKILINGIDLWSMDEKSMAKVRNSVIGYIPQGLGLLPNFTVLDNIRLPYYLSGRQGNGIEPAMNLLEEVGLYNLSGRYPAQLSGGETRRAAIARAFINNPELIIADEPTGDLDEEAAADVMKLFSELHRKSITILMVTHDRYASSFSSRIFRMSSGKLAEIII